MISEIVSNGMLALPNAMAIVGAFVHIAREQSLTQPVPKVIVPSLILTIFFGVFALFTAKLLIDFKLNHPHVHTMGMLCTALNAEIFDATSRGCRWSYVRAHWA